MTLPVEKFLERWTQHIPPAKMHSVRAYGLYASSNRKRLEQARLQLTRPVVQEPETTTTVNEAQVQEETKQKRCPICESLLFAEALKFEEPVRPWNVYRAKRVVRNERAPPGQEELSNE